MDLHQPLPWHKKQWNQLSQAHSNDRFPHALLLTGPAGVGKRVFASQLSRILLCQNPKWQVFEACNNCKACEKTLLAAHPDSRTLSPKEDKKEIAVDDIRNILNYIQLSSNTEGGKKILTIDPADRMNRNASNAILKSLEEPPKDRVFILIAESMGRLPATIRSRCQLLRFSTVKPEISTHWLNQATKGQYPAAEHPLLLETPLRALEAWSDEETNYQLLNKAITEQWVSVMLGNESALNIAQSWSDAGNEQLIIDWFQYQILLALRVLNSINSANDPSAVNAELIKSGYDMNSVLEIHNNINYIAGIIHTTVNSKLIWEAFLVNCHKMAVLGKVDK